MGAIRPVLIDTDNEFWEAVEIRQADTIGLRQNIYTHGPFIGAIGEIAFEYWAREYRPQWDVEHVGAFEYDYWVLSSDVDYTIEIKTKLRKTFPGFDGEPESSKWLKWDISVPQYLDDVYERSHITPDIYLAASVQSPLGKPRNRADITSVLLLGWIEYAEFQDLKRDIKVGSRMSGGRASRRAMSNIYIDQLNSLT